MLLFHELSLTDMWYLVQEKKGSQFLLNLIEPPSETEDANNFLLCDGAILVVDSVSGECLRVNELDLIFQNWKSAKKCQNIQ